MRLKNFLYMIAGALLSVSIAFGQNNEAYSDSEVLSLHYKLGLGEAIVLEGDFTAVSGETVVLQSLEGQLVRLELDLVPDLSEQTNLLPRQVDMLESEQVYPVTARIYLPTNNSTGDVWELATSAVVIPQAGETVVVRGEVSRLLSRNQETGELISNFELELIVRPRVMPAHEFAEFITKGSKNNCPLIDLKTSALNSSNNNSTFTSNLFDPPCETPPCDNMSCCQLSCPGDGLSWQCCSTGPVTCCCPNEPGCCSAGGGGGPPP
ncbi:hypothetical protein [Parvularcula marina]|uniref:hypothetical protein n=1 Tax=Parvularcula marina TaxID=2292771 RepID=UPI003514FFDB